MKVAVLLGGDSPERDVSLASGAGVMGALRSRGHDVCPVDPALPAGTNAEPRAAKIGEQPGEAMAPLSPEERFAWLNAEPIRSADIVFIALHGGSGEDGTVQALLEAAGIAYTGSGILGSALAMNKDRSKALFRESLVQTAPHFLIGAAEAGLSGASSVRERIEGTLAFPVVVKPNCQGSSVGFSFVRNADGLDDALRLAARFGGDLLIERYVPGREITAAVLGGEALPLVEIIPEGGFYDYKRKYTKGSSRYVAPAELDESIARRLRGEAVRAFDALACRDYARVDFRLSPEGEPYCLEVNTLPGMTGLSLVPMAAKAAGIAFEDLVERICSMAAARKGKTRS
ncbi:MAG: D-alanine--D-alanine ligase [Candidatus Krumholzibacteria bacterium]|nr:D-alanine--D-alanine ligase [Candidatus Krumholzibacteria bacterium]